MPDAMQARHGPWQVSMRSSSDLKMVHGGYASFARTAYTHLLPSRLMIAGTWTHSRTCTIVTVNSFGASMQSPSCTAMRATHASSRSSRLLNTCTNAEQSRFQSHLNGIQTVWPGTYTDSNIHLLNQQQARRCCAQAAAHTHAKHTCAPPTYAQFRQTQAAARSISIHSCTYTRTCTL